MTIRTTLALAVAATLSLATGAFAQADAPQPLATKATVKVGYSSKLTAFAPLFLAKHFKEFEKENLDVELVVGTPNNSLVLLSTGRLDVGLTQPSAAFFNAVASGADVKITAPGTFFPDNNKQGLWVSKAFLAGKPYSPALLKGQTIGSVVGYGSTISVYINKDLQKAGLTIKDVEFKQMGAADILAALENGAIPAGILNDPIWLNANPDKVQFAVGQPVTDTGGGWVYGPNLLKDKRDVGMAFMRAIARTTRLYLQGDYMNNKTVSDALVAELETPIEVLKKTPAPLFPADMQIPPTYLDTVQTVYSLTPGVLTYTALLPRDKVEDSAFVKPYAGTK